MAETSRDSFNILVIAEINGAKKYMYENGLIGLAHYLRNLPEADKPNLFVVNGGLLPEMPINRGGERNKDKLRVVLEGVNNIEGAAAVMKPHMERLMNALPEDSDFIYVMGKADQKNIDTIKLDLANLYLDAVKKIKQKESQNILEPRIEAVNIDIDSRKAIVESLKQAETALQRRIADTTDEAEKAQFKIELEKVKQNLKLNKEEMNEFVERKELLNILNQLIYTELPRDQIKEKITETKAKMREVSAALDAAQSGTQEYEELGRDVKLLGNRLRALSKRHNESADGESAKDLMVKHARIHKFTGHVPLPKNANDIVDLLAKSYYMTTLKDALGRKRDVTIQTGSLEVYERKLGGLEFNVIVTDGLRSASSMYRNNSNANFVKTAFVVTRNLGGEVRQQVDNVALNVLLGTRNGFSSFSLDPWIDQSNTVVAALSKGPFMSTEQNTLAYLNRTKTDETRIAERMVVDSSASLIRVLPDGGIVHTTLKAPKLDDERVKDDIEESKALDRLVARFKSGVKEDTGAEDPELARAILASRRPSEVKDRDLAHASEGILHALAPNATSAAPKDPQKISVVEFTDVHIGSYGNLEMLKAAAKDALARKPELLVLDGDNIEGNLRNYKYTARPENDVSIMDEFESWLKKKSLPQETVTKEILERFRKLRDDVISNIDNQPKVFVGAIQELVLDVVSRGGYVVVISGNHYNKTHGDSQHDEASILASHIEMLLEGASAGGKIPANWREHIKKGSGSDIAAETFKLNGMDVEVRHGLAMDDARVAGALVSKRSDAQLVITGHGHIIREVVTSGTEAVQGPTMQSTNSDPFMKRVYAPVAPENNFTGYLHLDVGIRDGKVVEHDFEPRLRQQLKVVDTLFTQFLRDRRSMTIPEGKAEVKVKA